MYLKNNSYNTEKTAPTQLDFFGRFNGLLTPLAISQRLLGLASGVLSGIVIAYIAQMQLPPTLPGWGVYGVMAAAFVLGFIIFDGFYIYIAETLFRMLRDGSFRQSLSMGIMAFFLLVVGGVIWYIDFVNSTKAGEILGGKTAEKPPLQQTDNLIAQQTAQAQMLTGTTIQQATLISESVKSQIAASESNTRSKIAKKEAEKNRYTALAADGNQWAKGKIAEIDRSIANIEAQKAKSIANIQNQAAKQLDKTSQSTDKALSKLTEQNAESVRVLNTYNTLRIKQFEDEYNRFAALGWLITAFLTIAPTLVTFLKVMIEVGSGIGITTEVRRRGFVAICQHHWQSAKEWFYDLIDPKGKLLSPASAGSGFTDTDTDADFEEQETQHKQPEHETEEKAPIATGNAGKQPVIGYFVPKNGFLDEKEKEDCRNCAIPPAEPQKNTVIDTPKTVITASKTAAYIADIARISAAIKASMSKLRADMGKPQSTAARVIYLLEKLTEAADTKQPVTVEKNTPAAYKNKTVHLANAHQAMQYLKDNYTLLLEAVGEKAA